MSRQAYRRSFRPTVEALETRTVPSACTVDRLTDNNPADGGEGSGAAGDLRWCVIESLFRADTIDFSVTGTINLARVLPDLSRSVSIEGPGADQLTVRRDTGGNYRIFTVATGITASISSLTISNGLGDASNGGGIFNSGTLTVSNSTVSGNTSSNGGGIFNSGTLTVSNSIISGNNGVGQGGGISNSGTLIVSNSTISGNNANSGFYGTGGGIHNIGTLTVSDSTSSGNTCAIGGGIYAAGTVTVINSTISSNNGGGIYAAGMLAVSNSTISGNTGGGIYVSNPMSVRNTIIAGNTASVGPDVFGNLGSRGHNLIGNPQEMTGWVDTDLLHVNPLLGPLADNGGPTRTMALSCGSPAIDAGAPDFVGPPDFDQRGEGYDRIVNGVVDIGAYEVQDGECSNGFSRPPSGGQARPIGLDFVGLLASHPDSAPVNATAESGEMPIPPRIPPSDTRAASVGREAPTPATGRRLTRTDPLAIDVVLIDRVFAALT